MVWLPYSNWISVILRTISSPDHQRKFSVLSLLNSSEVVILSRWSVMETFRFFKSLHVGRWIQKWLLKFLQAKLFNLYCETLKDQDTGVSIQGWVQQSHVSTNLWRAFSQRYQLSISRIPVAKKSELLRSTELTSFPALQKDIFLRRLVNFVNGLKTQFENRKTLKFLYKSLSPHWDLVWKEVKWGLVRLRDDRLSKCLLFSTEVTRKFAFVGRCQIALH